MLQGGIQDVAREALASLDHKEHDQIEHSQYHVPQGVIKLRKEF
jgi:hypothetical protein